MVMVSSSQSIDLIGSRFNKADAVT